MEKSPEHAYWIPWRKAGSACKRIEPGSRIYFGHETCQNLLPSPDKAADLARLFQDRSLQMTFVTPYLTDDGMSQVCRFMDALMAIAGEFEVVSSDWGLLHYLASRQFCRPSIGRLLTAQMVDPRIGRMVDHKAKQKGDRPVMHSSGQVCLLRHRSPSSALIRHYRGCWLDHVEIISFLTTLGIHRCEISNVVQGIDLASVPGWSYSLHVPDVIIAATRWCPGKGENFNLSRRCGPNGCRQSRVSWDFSAIAVPCFRQDNAIYYRWPELPGNLDSLPVDRIVHHDWAEACVDRQS